MSEQTVVFGGFGGQGLLVAGQVLATAAMLDGLEVSWMPSYGPEMRGGTASCTVIVSDAPIGSPIADRVSALVALNPPSLAKYQPALAPGGILVVNDSLIEAETDRTDVEVVPVACTRLARKAGDDRATAVVGLGALLACRPLVSARSLDEAIVAVLGRKHPEAVDMDRRAFELGAAAATARRDEEGDPAHEPAGSSHATT